MIEEEATEVEAVEELSEASAPYVPGAGAPLGELPPPPVAPLTSGWTAQPAAPAPLPYVLGDDSTHVQVTESELAPESLDAGQHERARQMAKQLAELLEDQLTRRPDKAREGRLHYEVARVYESPLHKFEEAARHYEHAARLMPHHVPSLRGARRVLIALGRHKQALKLFDAEIATTADSGLQATAWFQKGLLLAEQLAQKADARIAFERAAELAPNRLDVLRALAAAEEQAGAWRKLVSALERAANAAVNTPTERGAILSQMARVHAKELQDPQQAIECYKAALAADPQAPSALYALEELLYAERRWQELIEALELEASLATTRRAQAYAKLRAGQLWVERLGDLPRGTATIEQASALAPSDVTILEELVRLYDLADQPRNLVSALERLSAQLQSSTRGGPSLEISYRLGRLYEQQLNQIDLAIERYAQALSVNPAFRPATLALTRLWEQSGDWRALAEMLSKEAEASDDAEHRAALHVRIAELCEQRLGSVDYAIEHHKKALELRPDYEPAFKSLVRLFSVQHRWHELIEIYRRGIEVARSDDERIAYAFSIGRLQEEALGQPEAAVGTYEGILELAPSSLEAIHALQRAAERAGEHRALVDALLREVELSKERPRQLALRQRAASVLADELHEVDGAVEALRGILKSDPKYKPAIVTLAKLLHRAGRWSELVAAHAAELQTTTDGATRAQLSHQMGELCERWLNQPEQAIQHYRQAVTADPDHRAATLALRRLLTKVGQHEEVARLLEAEAKLSDEPLQAARVWLFLGEVCENHLNALDRSLAAYQRAAELDPTLRPAIAGSLRLLEQAGDHARLAKQLSVEQEEALEPMYAAAAAFRLGEVQRDHLQRLSDAAQAFEALAQRDPRHVGALLALERLYTQLGNREALASVYRRQAQSFVDPASRVAAYRGWLGVLEQSDPRDVESLRTTQLALLQVAPNDVQALMALESLALASDDPSLLPQLDAKLAVVGLDRHSTSSYQTRLAEAMEVRGDGAALELYRAALVHDPENMAAARGISRIAERAGEPALLAEAAEHEARCLGRMDEAARLLVIAAGKLATTGDTQSAARHLGRALHHDPEHARAADALVALQAQGVAPELVTDTLSRAATAAVSKERRAALWVQIAKIQSRALRDVGAATAAVKRALKERPNDVDAHLLLAHFHAGSKQWEECVTQLQALLKLNPGDEVRFDALLRLATIQHERLKATALAANHVAAALAMQPENREALELMLRVQLDREELPEAAVTAEKLVQTAKSDPERARALYHSARLYRQQGQLGKASEAFAEALSLTGTDDTVAQEYREWLEARRAKADWNPYAEALQIYLRRPGLGDRQVMWARRALGLVLYDELDRGADGLRELGRALELAPEDDELRRAYAERLERAGEYEAAALEYHGLLRAAPHAVNLYRSLATCYLGLGRAEQARAALAPLVASGEATDDERVRYRAVANHPGKARPGAFSEAARRAAEHDLSVSGPAVELLEALAPALPKLYPISFDRYAVHPKDKLVGRSSHPLRALAEDVAQVFGVQEFDLYVHGAGPLGLSVECGEHPTLFLHAEMAEQPLAERVFALARVFYNVARNTHVIDKLAVTELELLLVCAARNYLPSFGSELGDPGTLDAHARRINKALPWFKGSRVEPAARLFAQSGIQTQQWAKEAHASAIRAAALVCDDPAAALRQIAVAGADDTLVERVANFLASDAGQSLRQQLFP